MEITETLIVNTDGGARGNPGPAAIGVVIRSHEQKIIGEYKEYIGIATNNVAEYKALILALQKSAGLGAKFLKINMDSELIVRQMKGEYKIKEPALRLLAEEVNKLKQNFESVSFHHIRRALNAEADKLVNQAMDEALK